MKDEVKQIQYATAGDLSDLLGVKTSTILRWAQTGVIPCLRFSRRVIRFDISEVEKALKRRAQRTEQVRQAQIKKLLDASTPAEREAIQRGCRD